MRMLIMPNFPKIVCLCGSTRFMKTFKDVNFQETMKGNIVLSVGVDMSTDIECGGLKDANPEELETIKKRLDELHFRKIDLADEVLILNVNGYIGHSTRRELVYALGKGKSVRFLEDTIVLDVSGAMDLLGLLRQVKPN